MCYLSDNSLQNQIISNNTLITNNYSYPDTHILHIAYLNVLTFKNQSIQFKLSVDYFEDIQNSNNGYSIYKSYTLQKGTHNIKIQTYSNSNLFKL